MNQPRMNSYPSLFNSVLTMPIPGTKLAPEKFRGDFHKVKILSITTNGSVPRIM